MRYLVLGAGVQGSVYAAKLAAAGCEVSLVARGRRAAELRANGIVIEHAFSKKRDAVRLPVIERLDARTAGDVCLTFATMYWRRLLASPHGEYYFARHARRAAPEMQALANDVRALVGAAGMPQLVRLYAAIDRAASFQESRARNAASA